MLGLRLKKKKKEEDVYLALSWFYCIMKAELPFESWRKCIIQNPA